jgi:acyl transferase domain-containing protein/enoyl-CoA hydratase/carnithine racemase/acyl carrier protein/SAM-dependent methyltransferase/ribosomal protein S18 acetylase RimI-like enzyme
MLDLSTYYFRGYVAAPIVEACQQRKLFKLLDNHEFRERAWLINELKANEGYFAIALEALESLGWLEKKVDAYRLTAEANPYPELGLTPLYAVEPERLIAQDSHARMLREKIERVFFRSEVGDPASLDPARGAIIVPLVVSLQGLDANKFCEELERLSPPLSQTVIELFARRQWLTGDRRRLTASGKGLLRRGVFNVAASYRPALHRIGDLLFGDPALVFDDLINAEAFMTLAASLGLFNDDCVNRYPQTPDPGRIIPHSLTKRDYVIRGATEADLERLCQLEKLCWRHTQTPKKQILARMQKYPQGQFVLEKEGKTLGVIYSQRIASMDALMTRTADDVHELHQEPGPIIQLLAVNVDPQAQDLGYGDQLLEFMLQRCSLIPGVKQVVGVTLCKNYNAEGAQSFEEYIRRQGGGQDPVLTFHQAHGAEIVKAIPGYRPQDHINLGNGVLVAYDILNRMPRRQRIEAAANTATDTDSRITTVDQQQISEFIQGEVAESLGIGKSECDIDRPLMEMGLDSADLLKLQQRCEDRFGLEFQAGFFFEHSAIRKVIEYLTTRLAAAPEANRAPVVNTAQRSRTVTPPARGDAPDKERAGATDIAIVGMSCRLPGGIETPDQLWQALASNECVIGSFPRTRRGWPSKDDYPGIDQGGFVIDIDAFDAAFFRISAAEAQITDPQQRMLLELAWACLEDAGILPAALSGSNTGVFVGASNCDYSRLIQEAGLEIAAHHGIGSSLAILANRLSYFLDLSGPSLVVDTACSSSLVALHSAVQSLRSGECAAALVGGVNLICHPDLSIAYHKAGMLAPDGRCKVFDAKADGYVRSEGAVMLLLKPLSAAIAEGDQIHAVIRGSAVNHGGLAGGLTVPNPQKQSELLIAAWQDAGIAAQDLTYIEAHGTGTSLGDPLEIQGIQTAYRRQASREPAKPCAIGSVKSNLGHLESAAGITGLLKVILSIQHQQLPASINFTQLNPKIRLKDTPFCIQEQLHEWDAEGARVAAVSSFGSGGTNAHVVVQEYCRDIRLRSQGHERLFVLSAASEDRLRIYVQKVIGHLEQKLEQESIGAEFGDAIYTWQVGRTAMKQRLAIRVKGHVELLDKLKQWLTGNRDVAGIWTGQALPDDSNINHVWRTKSGRQLIDQALFERDLEQLGILWVSGIEIDWNKSYECARSGENRPQRVSLPTYPFAKERFWIDMAASEQGAARGVSHAGPTTTIIHSLLHSNTSDLSEQRFTSTFTGEEFFLTDHRVRMDGADAQKVLPGVTYLEMARVAIEEALPAPPESTALELRNTVWSHPIIVTQDRRVSIALAANDHEEIDYEIYSQETDRQIVHCQGRAVLSRQAAPARLDLDQLMGQMSQSLLEPSDVYAACARMGLVYGPSFQGIISIQRGSDQLLARLRLPRAVEETLGDYWLHPSLMDGALQACVWLIGASSERSNRPRLPFALESLRIVSPCSREMVAWARYSPGSQAGDTSAKLDVDLCDEQGNLCIEMRGFSFRALKSDEEVSLHPRQEIQPGLQWFVPVWNPVRLETHKKTILPGSTKILLLGTDQTYLDWVKKSHSNAYLLPLLSTSTIDFIQAKLKDCSFDQLLWIAPDVPLADGRSGQDDDRIIEQQELGVLAVFRIIRALIRLGYGDKELQWTIITGNTQRVRKDEPIQPTHAGIFGLVGSLAKEYPHWKLSMLDVDSLESVAANECLSMAPDKRGAGLAYRRGAWFHHEFAHIPILPQSAPIHYRQNGVYVVIGGAGGLGEAWSRFMIEHYQANMVWIGLHKYNATIEDKINSLSRLGPAPLYISADATDFDALEHAFRTILKTYPAIHGVVHSAIILHDQSIARIEESEFRTSLSAKVDISVNMDRVFGEQELDFMLFFSSIISFVKSPGQSNYAAGCTFKDSFAQRLQQQRAYPVKIMNWGYWGKVGVVADEYYNKAMERMGIGSIESNEGMACLQTFVSSELSQVGLIKIINAQAIADISFSETLTWYPKASANAFPQAQRDPVKPAYTGRLAAFKGGLQTTGIDAFLAEILASSLVSLGLFRKGNRHIADLSLDKPPASFYEQWLSGSIQYLQQRKLLGEDLTGAPGVRALADLWFEWEERKIVWAADPDQQAQIALLEACLKGLPSILSGKKLATDVIFPDSSMRLVEGIYRGNALADYFNEALGDTLAACIEHMLRADQEHKISILEIGAGTGGTTAKLLPLLQRFPIDEYCYTDISKAFLMHAEEQYQPQFPALTTAIFDVSKPLALQSIAAGHYDVVIAANVLHATPNIRETLRNAKAMLKNQGVLLLNEISAWSLFTHLTFGLLEGWWLPEDTALRLPGSPGLAPEKWQEILAEEGFESIFFPAEEAHKFGQQIIVASSDGWARQRLNKQPVAVLERKPPASALTAPATAMNESTYAEESLREKAISYFQRLVASTLKMRLDQIEPRRPLAEYGLDSILVGQLTYQLRKAFSNVTGTLFFEVQSLDGLVDYFLENKEQELVKVLSMTGAEHRQLPAPARSRATSTQGVRRQRNSPRPSSNDITQEQKTSAGAQKSVQHTFQPAPDSSALTPTIFDVAIVGLSGRYPRANSLKEFWINLSNAANCITEIPGDRWRWAKYYDPEKGKPGKIYTKWGGFIEGIDQFDPLFFKISPKEAKRMDPQERIFLESCYHAMEDAGYTPENLGKAEKIGVFVGVMNSRYTPQPAHSSIANRVSYVFNFQGPSMAIDTACSSSLTAIHVALESIYSGLIECAIVGGVNVIIDPVHYLYLTEMTMLSGGKQCKAFGDQADGFIVAEGVGAIILKPLRQAQQDGDHIYAVIKGSAVNAGGKTNGYTVPNPKAQAKVVSRALERAKVTAEHLSYVEAHGTGTALGDPIEIAGLTRAFKETTDKKQFCSIGSLKSNIGHCESAAGIAGLTKVLLQLKYEELAPSLHSETPNPEIDFGQTPFNVQKSLEKWRRPLREVNGEVQEIPRIAGVSSFGAGGSNAHVIVQEYIPPVDVIEPAAPGENTKVIIVLSARTAEQLKQKARDLLDFIREEEQSAISSGKVIDLSAMAYTLQVGREAMEERLGFLAPSIEQLVEKLRAYVAGEQDIEGAYQGQAPRNKEALSLFSTDADLQQTVEKWIANRKLSKLLEMWVKGLDLDWSKLYGGAKPRRMSLPTYPFAKERYWMDAVAGAKERAQGTTTAVLHPLLHSNTSDLSEQRYSSTFTGEEFFLADHQARANGHASQKALPSVAYLEMARAAIEHALPARPESTVLELRNTVWAQPTVVGENKQISIALAANNHDGIDYEIYSQGSEQEFVYCQGIAVLRRQPAPALLDLDRLKGQMGRDRLEPSSIYAVCARMGLVYGPSFQGITAIHRGSGQLLAYLRLPSILKDTSGDYWLHPSLMDGALQACVGLIDSSSESSNRPRLPVALESLRIVSPCSREMVAWARYSPGSQAGDEVIKLDLDLCDERGNIAVQMRGINWRRTSPDRVEDIAEPIIDKAASLAVPAALKEITPAAPARREIVLVPNQQATPAPVERKRPVAISLATPSALVSSTAAPSENMAQRPFAGKPPIALSNAALGAPIEGSAAPAVSSVRLYDCGAGIFSIEIAAPVGGAISAKDLIAHLPQALDRAQQEASLKVLIISGAERCFLRGGREDYNEAIEQKLYQAIVSFPYPVIAVLGGAAIGAGFLLAALCDFMVCNEDAQYGYTDAQRHFCPTTAEAIVFGERFGEVRAQDLLYLSTASTGKRLRSKGWTCPFLPGAEVEVYAEQLARAMATKSRDALRLLKHHLTRRLVGLVEALTRVEVAADAAENPSDARVSTARGTDLEHIHLDTPMENVLVIKFRNAGEQMEAAVLAPALGHIIAEVNQNASYKAVVLVSEYPDFLPGAERAIPFISEDVALEFQRIVAESEIPVVAALAGNAKGPAWLVSQFCDTCVYSQTGVYSSANIGHNPVLAQTAAAIFANRFGGDAANEILLTGGDYSGADLQRRVGALIVAEQEQVLSAALKVAESWARLPRGVLAAWKKHTSTILQEKIRSLPAALKWERKDEAPEPQVAAPTPIALHSKVVTATAHPDGIVVVKMEDRESKNMFSDALVAGVTEVFAHIEQTPAYKVVILTGYDSYFASGGDKEGLLAIGQGKASFTDFNIYQSALDCPLPVIAAMQGHGIGAGWSMGMFADIALIGEESRYVSPYMDYGFTPGAGATWILAEKIGQDLARESLLTARYYAGSELKDRGLRLRVAPRAEVYPAAMALAKQIAQAPRSSLIGLKRQATRHFYQQLEETYRLELAMHEKTFVGRSDTLAQIQDKFYQEIEPQEGLYEAPVEPRNSSEGGQPQAATANRSIDSDALRAISADLKTLLSNELQMRESDVDDRTQFVDLGLDSISGVTWVRKINEKYQTSIGATKVYSYPTLVQLSRYVKEEVEKLGMPLSQGAPPLPTAPLVADTPAPSANGALSHPAFATERTVMKLTSRRSRAASRFVASAPATCPSEPIAAQPIAVIGMAGQFPQARNVEEFWQNIAGGRNCITEVPRPRWDVNVYYQPGEAVMGKTNSRWSGTIDEYDLFDPLFFDISPAEAESMDPQQRLFLQACWHTIENAGYAARSLSGSKCGVFVGCTGGDYHWLSRRRQLSAQGFTGGANSILAARISYFLNLQGPCISIDTACSSSLVAIAQACDSLTSGSSDLALAGGVYVMVGPDMHIKTSQTGMLSPEGRCFTFDERADGFVPGEGVGVVLLKRLADAERDHDMIHAVIDGWGVNQDGRTNGITAPNPESQTRLEQEVYDKFGIDPASIQLIEAHGTGTKLGDPIEVEGLKNAFKKYTQKKGYCALGSVKSNIGHCLAAAGIAGSLKLILALKRKQLPPTINFERLNEHIDLTESPFYVNTQLQEWEPGCAARRQAAISSFGFSGTNAHMVIGEYTPPAEAKGPVAVMTQSAKAIVPLSARTAEQLEQKSRDLLDFIRREARSIDLVEMAYTLQVGREAMDQRLGVLASSVEQLAEKLEAYINGERRIEDLHRGYIKRGAESVNIINQDDDVKETIVEKWIANKKFSRLLELWVNGLEVDWNKLYGEAPPQRVTLPTYPFAKERYWIDTEPSAAADGRVAAEGSAVAVLHPLLHANTSDLSEQRYSSTFSGEEFFLTDHRVRMDGGAAEKLLSGAACLEMARVAIEQAAPIRPESSILELHNMVWLKPIVVTDPKQVSIALFATDNDRVDYEIYSIEAEQETLHCQGQAVFSRQSAPARLDLEQLRLQMGQGRLDAADVYTIFARMGLHYGPAHQGITVIHLGEKQVLAQLRAPEVVETDQHKYVLHPSLMDSALQASIGLIVDLNHVPTKPYVPFTVESLRVLSACAKEMVAFARYSNGGQPGDKTVKVDIDLCDERGNVCVQMRGFALRVLGSEITSGGQKTINKSTHNGSTLIEDNASFDKALYQKLIAGVLNGAMSVDEAVELG